MSVELRHLRHVADLVVRSFAQLVGYFDAPAVRRRAEYGLDERTFSAAVGTYYADEIVGVYVEIDSFERDATVVCDSRVAQRDYFSAFGGHASVACYYASYVDYILRRIFR